MVIVQKAVSRGAVVESKFGEFTTEAGFIKIRRLRRNRIPWCQSFGWFNVEDYALDGSKRRKNRAKCSVEALRKNEPKSQRLASELIMLGMFRPQITGVWIDEPIHGQGSRDTNDLSGAISTKDPIPTRTCHSMVYRRIGKVMCEMMSS